MGLFAVDLHRSVVAATVDHAGYMLAAGSMYDQLLMSTNILFLQNASMTTSTVPLIVAAMQLSPCAKPPTAPSGRVHVSAGIMLRGVMV